MPHADLLSRRVRLSVSQLWCIADGQLWDHGLPRPDGVRVPNRCAICSLQIKHAGCTCGMFCACEHVDCCHQVHLMWVFRASRQRPEDFVPPPPPPDQRTLCHLHHPCTLPAMCPVPAGNLLHQSCACVASGPQLTPLQGTRWLESLQRATIGALLQYCRTTCVCQVENGPGCTQSVNQCSVLQ